jgi:hypothetical protein
MADRNLDPRPAAALSRLWGSARSAQQAAAVLATRAGLDTDLRYSIAAGHCGEAADELQRARPDVAALADIPALAADVQNMTTAAASDRLLAAIATAIADLNVDDPRLLPTDMLAAATAANWLALAHHALSGLLP